MTIRTRILIPMIVFTLIASSVVLVSNIAQFSRYVEDDINRYLHATSDAAFDRIETYESYALTASMFISECPTVVEVLQGEACDTDESRMMLSQHVLQHMVMQLQGQSAERHSWVAIDFCTISDASGNVVLRTHDSQTYGDNVSNIQSVKSALSGELSSGIEAGPVARLTVGAVTPVFDSEGKLVGTVAIGFRLDKNDFVDSVAETFDCVVTVSLGDERVSTTLQQSDGTRATGTKIQREVAERVLAGETVTGRVPILGREAITRHVPIRDNEGNVLGILLVASYLDKVAITIWAFVRWGLLFTLIVLAASAPIIIIISKRIARPISEASGVLSKIAGGDFNARITGNYRGDLSVLQNSVNDTAAKLAVYLKEKLQEDKLRELAAIAAVADAGIVVKDKGGAVRQWNIGAENILGYKPEEMFGNTTHYYAPEESGAGIDEIEARLAKGEHIAHVEVVRKHRDGYLVDCSASYTPIFDDNGSFDGSVAIFHDITSKKQIESALKEALLDTEKKNQTIMASIDYASKIQRNLLPKESAFAEAFSDYSIIWSPRDTVGGDIYWMKSFEKGSVLCVCDCTGHGTPGALLTMMVASAFEDTVNEDSYRDTARIIWLLEQRLVNAFSVNTDDHTKSKLSELKDGCDLAVLYIANDGSVTISSGKVHVFVCDGNKVQKIKGQKISVGEGNLKGAEDVVTVNIKPCAQAKFYIASDGLFDQIGGQNDRPFGYREFKRIILEHHAETQAAISERVWGAFEAHRGDQPRRDDVELITFKPRRAGVL